MFEVRRDEDDELCGHVTEDGEGWRALTVFGGHLGAYASCDEAVGTVTVEGLAALTALWLLTDGETGEEQVVRIQQASPNSVTVGLGYYSVPGTPSLTLTREELEAHRWELRLCR